MNKLLSLNLTYNELALSNSISAFVAELASSLNAADKKSIQKITKYLLDFRLEDNKNHGDCVLLELSNKPKRSRTAKK